MSAFFWKRWQVGRLVAAVMNRAQHDPLAGADRARVDAGASPAPVRVALCLECLDAPRGFCARNSRLMVGASVSAPEAQS